MNPYSEAATPAPPINFSQWDEEKRLPSVATLGYSPTEIQTLLRHRYALTDLMGEHFDHLFRRSSGKLNTKGRALAAFEHYDRRTTYEEIASACGISATSAYRVMLAVRKYVESATSLLIVSNGPVVEIASSQTCALTQQKLDKHLLKVERSMQAFHRQLQSLAQLGQAPELNMREQGWYLGFCKAHGVLPAGSQDPEISSVAD